RAILTTRRVPGIAWRAKAPSHLRSTWGRGRAATGRGSGLPLRLGVFRGGESEDHAFTRSLRRLPAAELQPADPQWRIPRLLREPGAAALRSRQRRRHTKYIGTPVAMSSRPHSE